MSGHDSSESKPPMSEAVRVESWLVRAIGGKFGYLLGALIALLLSAPLIVEGWAWSLLLGLCAGAVIVASLHAARPGRRSLTIGLILALADFGIGRLVFIEGARWLVVLQAALWLSTLLYVTFTILGAVFETKHVDVETLQAALCVYLLVGLIWAYLYDLIELAAPGSFRSQGAPMIAWSDDPSRRSEFLRLLILSYSKLTSSGSEDLAPATGFARISVCLEALSGQVYLAVVIARLVGMQADHPPNGHKHGQETRIGDESVTGPIPSDGGFS